MNTLFSLRRFISSSYFIVTLATLCVFSWVMWGKDFSIFIPWRYAGDAFPPSVLIKSFIETGNYWKNNALSFPSGFQFYDFPIDELGNYFIIYVESFFTSNYAVVLNVFYFLTFLFSALTSVYTCKKLGLSQAFSLCISLLFSFSSYHLMRGEAHIYLSSYLSIPIYTLLMIFIFFNNIKLTKIRIFFLSLVVLFCASTGIYYAFFACYFFIVIGISGSLIQKSWTPILRVFVLIGLIGFGVLIGLFPSILYHMHYGVNEAVGQRAPVESEVYGLKIMALLLPAYFSGFSFLDNLSKSYYASSSVGVNMIPYLGIVGSIGFVFLLFVSLNARYLKSFNEKIIALSTLNLSAILLGTIGGLGAFFAYAFSPQIRCYDRISIFILYFSLLGVALFLEVLLSKYCESRFKTYSWLVASCLLIFGLYNQAGNYHQDYISIQEKFNNDKNFVQVIENHLPKGGAVFQLPYWSFPESAGIYHALAYDCFRGYFHSTSLKWGCGAMRGRPVAAWQAQVSELPAPKFLESIILAGFSGLYIDRNGYEDHGKLIETQIGSLLGIKPLVSENNELAFFDLGSYAKTILSNMPAEEAKEKKEELKHLMSLQIHWDNGYYGERDKLPPLTWRWVQKKATLSLINFRDTSLRVKLNFELMTSQNADVTVGMSKAGKKQREFAVKSSGTKVTLMLMLEPGINKIYFSTNAPRVYAPADPREMYFAIRNVQIIFRESSEKPNLEIFK